MSKKCFNPIKLVHIPRFRSTRSLWMYYELQELYENNSINALPPIEITTFIDIPDFRRNKPEWLLKMNPNGKVPSMAHDSILLFESGAICSYLLDQFDIEKKLLPQNSAHRALYFLFNNWCASTIDNLSATSSPMNILLKDNNLAKPMYSENYDFNKKYFDEIFSPYMRKLLQ